MKIVIVGGGFGGVKAALELAKDTRNQITLISDRTDFQYYPALFSAATGHSHLESWVPLGTIFAGVDTVQVRIDTILSINPEKKTVLGKSGRGYEYDACILALGTVTTYFGIKGLDTYAYGIKSAEEIRRLKQHLYHDIAERHTVDKHYVVVGAGPTGVELAAALGSYVKRLCRKYNVRRHSISIELVELAPRVLPRMSEAASRAVEKRLRHLGVRVHTGRQVQSASANDLVVSGKPIESRTVIWTSGVANNPFYNANQKYFTFAPSGRIVVDKYLQATDNVYVIGDNAATPYTGFAQTALHDAVFVARNLRRRSNHQKQEAYTASMPAVVVPVGENWAIAEWKGIRLSGWLGSCVRRAADFLGYSDILPIGQALGVWRTSKVMEDDYFAAESSFDDPHAKR